MTRNSRISRESRDPLGYCNYPLPVGIGRFGSWGLLNKSGFFRLRFKVAVALHSALIKRIRRTKNALPNQIKYYMKRGRIDIPGLLCYTEDFWCADLTFKMSSRWATASAQKSRKGEVVWANEWRVQIWNGGGKKRWIMGKRSVGWSCSALVIAVLCGGGCFAGFSEGSGLISWVWRFAESFSELFEGFKGLGMGFGCSVPELSPNKSDDTCK